LSARGYAVRGVTRDADNARRRFPDREWAQADLGDGDAVRAALRGCSAGYYLVHGMGTPGDYRRREADDARIFAEEAAEAGLERIVYLGGVHPTLGGDASSEHLLSRARVGEILAGGSVPVLELRASMIVGDGSLSFLIVRDLAARLPFMILPKWLDSKTEPVAIDDVLVALERGLRIELPHSQAFDLPGPEILSGREILMRTARALGLAEPLAVRVPVLTPGLSARWVRFVTRAQWSVAKEIVVGLTTDLVAENDRYWQAIGLPARVDFDEAARRAIAEEPAVPGGFWRLMEGAMRRFRGGAAA
jgi:uncharacterized protein YbjT (DUF2867 family)